MDRGTLLEYLRQRAELGDHALYLETMSASEFIRRMNAPSLSSDAHGEAQTGTGVKFAQLTILQEQAAACTACGLHATRKNPVFARGSALSKLMIVGEAPGEEEDKTGLPFVGRAGKLLDQLLQAVGFPRDSVYICNVLKCRPPNNRNPLPNEVASCSGFLRGQIESIAPGVLLAVGKFAAQTLLQSEESIGRLRGQIHTYHQIPVVVTYHPAYLLRSPQATRVAWHDFQLVRKILDEQT
ncbi:MAG TPA: uracil-DNA glycosylase [Longimicrobiales bacterium]